VYTWNTIKYQKSESFIYEYWSEEEVRVLKEKKRKKKIVRRIEGSKSLERKKKVRRIEEFEKGGF
jgi:hypothetical protein